MKEKKRKLVLFFCLLSLGALILSGTSVRADGRDDALAYIDELRDILPDAIADELPDDYGDTEAVSSLVGVEKLFSYVSDAIVGEGSACPGAVVTILSVTLLACGVSVLMRGILTGSSMQTVSALVAGLGFSAVGVETVKYIGEYLNALRELTGALSPILLSVLLAGGNSAGAAASSSALALAGSVLEGLCLSALSPMIGATMALATVSPLGDGRCEVVSRELKKIYVFILMATSTLITASLAFQSALAAAGDSLAVRGVKFAFGQSIPIVGSSLSDSLRSVASALSYVKSTVGVASVGAILMLCLPPLAYITVLRMTFSVAAAVADMLDCKGEARVCRAFLVSYDACTALVTVSSVLFILIITVFIGTSVALGG